MKILKSSPVVTDPSFLNRPLPPAAECGPDVRAAVNGIIADVAARGDAALLEYTKRFDGTAPENAADLRISEERVEAAYKAVPQEIKDALRRAAERVELFHENSLPSPSFFTDGEGVELGNIWRPMERAGIYVPGGKAAYPSSVIMGAIPAKVAGVKEIVIVTPAPGGEINDTALAAARICGVSAVYAVGGAQAIAALAYGTETVPAVNIIAGPGNKYVAEAKRAVFGICGIDMIAGPSEILVLAEDGANPAWAAADLLSQAEHDEDAKSYLVCFSEDFAQKTIAAVEEMIPSFPRAEIMRASWQRNGAVIVADNKEEALAVLNKIAPEHAELLCEKPEEYLPGITSAGAVFAGHYAPEAIGDYNAGPSHVLPTAGSAAFSSGISVYTFLKRMSYISNDRESFNRIAEDARRIAEAEGLHAHARSLTIRRES